MAQFQAKGARFRQFTIDATSFGLVPVSFFTVPFDIRWMGIQKVAVDNGILLYFNDSTTPVLRLPDLSGLAFNFYQLDIPLAACQSKLLDGTSVFIANDTGVSAGGVVTINVAG